ncbi:MULTISPECIES: pantetheine-phosphate adenylyltransferase [Aerococcus]|uniref:Phosphopantetheine adenylyltransferase n=1 Tax=Aerococcus sanguinicola TaxID=119206 RepID=A0A5N1GPV6_9LACT|nr:MULTISPECIES: pantetheine-phosphate adenylyltransferase [Aerococcus]KAA9302289.1 pantetheine-phosphate adenylyltransferase [Aerococcus sanguinicola]MDK6369043.1 pantetheine-phosphate adenylyltransferase [Aerococcus sp. UMB9870]MDK6678945.1 pantetheine-phosphate adenylyltransferase [Aerococcus sp. UMB8608]MDK6686536.1 pantetheine-phosphate adenylyltransferase [Aerococcus sp. UMB8623]MDK6939604.1 pantetheine-phosphate adenylyltransferase [Aerococcus sp. UMB8487]
MSKKALYAGSFDPITRGHLDIIQRGARLFDQVYVAIASNTSKQALFGPEEKASLVEEVTADLANVQVVQFTNGLTVDLARELGATALLRGIRNNTDFEYEMNMAEINKLQAPDIETVILLSDAAYRAYSSSMIKEVASFGGEIEAAVPQVVAQAMSAKYKANRP